jgi:lysozyme
MAENNNNIGKKETRSMSKAAELIKLYEGIMFKVYKCSAGVPTIGYGSTFYEDGSKVKMTDKPITQERADALLEVTMAGFEAQLEAIFRKQWETFNEGQKAALLAFTFNCGAGTLKKCRFFKAIVAGETDQAKIANMLATSVTTAAGKPLKGLQRRRLAESLVFLGEDVKTAFNTATKTFP